MGELDALQRARGKTKQQLVAQAIVIAKELETAGERIRGYVAQMKDGDIEEWRMVEEITAEVYRAAGESPIIPLVQKYELFLITDMEMRRAVNNSAFKLGVFDE